MEVYKAPPQNMMSSIVSSMSVFRHSAKNNLPNRDAPYTIPTLSSPAFNRGGTTPVHTRYRKERCFYLPKRIESTLNIEDLYYYTTPVECTIAHPNFKRVPKTGTKTDDADYTLAFIESTTICSQSSAEFDGLPPQRCAGSCRRCVSARCHWCDGKLIENSCFFNEALFGSYLGRSPPGLQQKLSYRVSFLVVYPNDETDACLDSTYDVCSYCIHDSIACSTPLCHDPENNVNLYQLWCWEVERRFRIGDQMKIKQKLDALQSPVELYRYVNGVQRKLSQNDLLKVLGNDLSPFQDQDQVTYYGQLDGDPVEDTRNVSQELNLNPSKIGELVALNSV